MTQGKGGSSITRQDGEGVGLRGKVGRSFGTNRARLLSLPFFLQGRGRWEEKRMRRKGGSVGGQREGRVDMKATIHSAVHR